MVSAVGTNDHEIVIVGGGIVGLATALALHMKGVESLVLERSETLRAAGATIAIFANGWRCLDQLGVGEKLREKAALLKGTRDLMLYDNTIRDQPNGNVEQRCVKRSDLIKTLAEGLSSESIRFNSRVVAVEIDDSTSYPVVHLDDGNLIHAKILIGCDGAHSLVAENLGFGPAKFSGLVGIRGLTTFAEPHGFPNEFYRFRGRGSFVGRTPIDDHVVSWFLARPKLPGDSEIMDDPELMRDSTAKLVKELSVPSHIVEIVKNCDLETLSYTSIRYKTPWDLLVGSFRKGTITVAGDSMHVMGPYLQQGGATGLEDAVVLGRCLADGLQMNVKDRNGKIWREGVEMALDKYVKERRMRIFMLSLQSYLFGAMAMASSKHVKLAILIAMMILFGHRLSHTRYDCGKL
ncbi:monooxygenase 1-like [Aristolochia californica]|uniref:monooxygenase 1-like n=1 Tax=Aristolochia californica TaxID=171875 RepID=UPI0035DD4586